MMIINPGIMLYLCIALILQRNGIEFGQDLVKSLTREEVTACSSNRVIFNESWLQ